MQANEKVFGQTEEGTMTGDERRRLIEYLEQQGWTAQQIVDLFKYLSK